MKKLLLIIMVSSAFIGINAQSSAIFTTKGKQIISPGGEPINLCGWRIDFNGWGASKEVSQADFTKWNDLGLLGNAQGIEIWWSREFGTTSKPGVSEGLPYQIGVYNQAGIPKLLECMRNIARSGSYIIPSIRVSYDEAAATENCESGTNTWMGWAVHRKVIYNSPVIVSTGPNAGTYGNHRDRFFAWLDWLLPQILADKEIADHIAYWEMWHYYGHRHSSSVADRAQYLDDFMPRLIAKYRQHDPDRLLGVGLTLDASVNDVNARLEAGTWVPYEDKNWMFVVGGYGILGVIMRPDINVTKTTWPVDSKNPLWISSSNEFNIQKLVRLSGHTTHSQEGPGLRECFRETPIPQLQRTWLTGLFNLYNSTTNGFGHHAWPPSWANQNNSDPLFGPTENFDETDFFNIMRKTLKGIQVNSIYTSVYEVMDVNPFKMFTSNNLLKVEGLSKGQLLKIFNMSGALCCQRRTKGDLMEIFLPRGFYIVSVNNHCSKIIIP